MSIIQKANIFTLGCSGGLHVLVASLDIVAIVI